MPGLAPFEPQKTISAHETHIIPFLPAASPFLLEDTRITYIIGYMGKVAGVQKPYRYELVRFVTEVRQWLLCVVITMALLGAGTKADNPDPDWELVFQDEFSASSFSGKKLKWGQKWAMNDLEERRKKSGNKAPRRSRQKMRKHAK